MLCYPSCAGDPENAPLSMIYRDEGPSGPRSSRQRRPVRAASVSLCSECRRGGCICSQIKGIFVIFNVLLQCFMEGLR